MYNGSQEHKLETPTLSELRLVPAEHPPQCQNTKNIIIDFWIMGAAA